MGKMDLHRDLFVFVQVAESGGFGRAASVLGVSTSQTSRAVARLEDALGTQLLIRTTRHVSLTEAGRALYERSRHLLADLDEAFSAVRDLEGEPRGTLRASLPVDFGVRYVAPVIARYTARWPGLNVELGFDDRRVDLLAEGWDLAVRIGVLSDSSLVARRLGVTRSVTVASPSYLAAHGTPQHPRDLAEHEVLLYRHDEGEAWRFRGPDGEVSVPVRGRFLANHGAAIREAALLGLGIARLPDFLLADDVDEGRLVRLLQDWEQEVPVSVVYPPARHLSPKVRRLVDALVEASEGSPWSPCARRRAGAIRPA